MDTDDAMSNVRNNYFSTEHKTLLAAAIILKFLLGTCN